MIESLNAGIYAVAGVTATLERWQKFEVDRACLLDGEGLTCFHAKDFVHSKGSLNPGRTITPVARNWFSVRID